MATKYDESNITYFSSDLKKIRAKSAMYIGPIDDAGIFTIFREALDNSVDEARAGRNKLIHAFIDKGCFWVRDEGVGIPVKKHAKAGISTLTHVLTALQSSGKMSGDAYKSAIGTHGVGIKATNALSSSFEVWTYREDAGGWHYTKFESGVEKVKVKKSDKPKLPDGTKPKSGTVIRFTPDTKIFGKAKLQAAQLLQWCEITAYMNKGLKIQLTNPKGQTKTWLSKDGIKEYLDKRLLAFKATALNTKPLVYSSGTLELALSFADVEGCEVEFFTNTIRNVDKGFHADAFFRALVKALDKYKGKMQYKPSDLQEGLVGILNYKIDAPQFSSQTKEKLVDVRMKEPCYQECLELLNAYFTKNKSLAKDLVKRASEIRDKTDAFLKDKKLVKNVKNAQKSIQTKLAAIVGKAPVEQRELYIVEGDSAGGGLIRSRNRAFQAIYPLRGKPLNTMEAAQDKINNNAEVVGLLAALGIDLTGKTAGDIAYGKVITMADPDVDGDHITALLLGNLWKFQPRLFKEGKVFIVLAPLFKTRYKGKVHFGMTKEELYTNLKTKNLDITYIKGWGEVDEEDLQIALNPELRTLFQVMPPENKKGVEEFKLLLGKNPAYRKTLFGVA